MDINSKYSVSTLFLILLLLAFNFSFIGKVHAVEDSNSDSDLEIIRDRVIEYLMSYDVDVDMTREIFERMAPEGSWPDINYDDVSRTGWHMERHLLNTIEMARAFRKPGTSLYGKEGLRQAVHAALDFWLENDFIADNWAPNQKWTPLQIITIMLIMDPDLTEEQRSEGLRIAWRANMDAWGARPGGDRIFIARTQGKQALFKRDKEMLDYIIGVMIDDINITTGRGIKPDLSYHHRHDNVISTLVYGRYPPRFFGQWANFIKGTSYSFPDYAIELAVDYYLDGFCASMVYGKYPDPGACNRDISRPGALDPMSYEIPYDLYRASNYRKEDLDNIVNVRKGESIPGRRYTRFFWHSEYFSHQRPDWFASVRMYSERNNNMEEPYNGEGLLNHHYADGSNFLTIDANEYYDIYPVWDWQRVPGTTVVQKPDLPHWDEIVKKGRTSFVGAVTDNEYGAAVFDFESIHDPLKARKSWFFFDNEYVCLGSGITSTAGYPVNTTISQRYLDAEVYVSVGGSVETILMGEHEIEDVAWVHHDNVAYLFPDPVKVNIRNDKSSGSWRRINHRHWASDDIISSELFTLWLDHGTEPVGSGYQYIVLPLADINDAERYRREMPVNILANNNSIQAVENTQSGIVQVVFYEPGQIEFGRNIILSSDKPSVVMVKTSDGTAIERIAVADPSRDKERIELTISSRVRGSGDKWNSVWTRREGVSRITIDLPAEEMAGQSVVIDF